MDKSWMTLEDRRRPEYENGVQQFLNFAYSSIQPGESIRCPCRKCNNVYFQNRGDVEADLLQYGIIRNYNTWVLHGEELDESDDEEFDFDEEEDDDQVEFDEVNNSNPRGNQNEYADIQSMLEDCYTASTTNSWRGDESLRNENAVPESESDKFMRLLRDADTELYPSEKFTKLSFVVTLMHLKILSRWSNKSFSMLLEILKKALPNGPTSPGNDIDVFLEPLIDELKDLWDHGVETYDASTGTNFNLRAAILWTIHDFPGYGIISGWSTKGEHKEELKQNGGANVEKRHEESFSKWFEERVVLASSERSHAVSEDLVHLAYGPDKRVTHYEACIVNGIRSVQKDKYGCTSINTSKPWKTNEPYVLASQAQQVFYVNDIKLGNDWKVVIEAQGRSSWNILENKEYECVTIDESCQHNQLDSRVDMEDFLSDTPEWLRNDIPPTAVDSNGVTPIEEQEKTPIGSLDMATRSQGRREQTQVELDSQEPPSESIVAQQIDNNTEGSSSKKRKGITTGISVEKKRGKAEKLEVTIHLQRQRIVGKNAKDFKTEVCVVIKQHAPLQYARWKDIPTDIIKKMWLAMKQKFNLQENFQVKKIVIDQLNRQYRSRRHKLHAYYLKRKDDEDILHKPPNGVLQNDWEQFMNYVESDEFKRLSDRNKENRKKLTMSHACGKKSIAQYCFEERDPKTEQEPTRTDAWRITRHSNKKNGWVDQASEDNLTRLQRTPIEEGEDPMNEDEAFIQVFGEEKSSRLRGCGDGLKPPSKRQRINTELEKENEELRKKEEDSKALETLKEKNKEMALRLESLESQVNNQEAQVQSQVQDFLKSQLPAIIQNLGISGHPLANCCMDIDQAAPWSNDELLALLKLTSTMDIDFTWQHVSRKEEQRALLFGREFHKGYWNWVTKEVQKDAKRNGKT
ncbi:hypothetical protein BUALT_Bualt01G0145100 [Buddleja alternifolia]|uniref:Transposase-associated domain-containing protein n=1 Tax=Buddleja alternifolia TaxID=168488 RepID=A0AAV6YB95_9LAMI|nr:hypothetical protein BUALT_Bualt01G0145100 [Buddleja alternifolia]